MLAVYANWTRVFGDTTRYSVFESIVPHTWYLVLAHTSYILVVIAVQQQSSALVYPSFEIC